MNECKKCNVRMDDQRIHLGYTECPSCSETEKYSAHVVYPHKTGAFVQPVTKTASNNLKRMDRRSVGGGRVAKGVYVDNSWDRYLEELQNPTPPKKKFIPKPVRTNYRSYNIMSKPLMKYYSRFGYEPALKQLKKIYKNDKITLQTYQRIQNDINTLQQLPARLRRRVQKIN